MASGKKKGALKSEAHEPALNPVVGRLIEEMGRFYESYGIPRIGGRITALLITADRPLSAEEIARRLHVARSSVSTNLTLLQNKGSAVAVTFPGDRLTYFRFSWETWQMVIKGQVASFGRVKDIMQRALSELEDGNPIRGRLIEYNGWVDFFVTQYKKILENWPKGDPA
jgi:DNA-binding transcriptional regulator GbsR (MarR family)